MNSLPPFAPVGNKVKTRSKTQSTKRPISCDVNDMVKKETKGLFNSLRKGASNSKLNEDPDQQNDLKEEKGVERKQGRLFDSEDDDYDLTSNETYVTKMDKVFHDYLEVVNNPALIGYLVQYLTSHNRDFNGLLFYLVVQHYKATVVLKEYKNEAPRFVNEIITTFILEKSNLKIDHKFDTSTILNDLKSGNNLQNIFDKSLLEIYKPFIENNIDKIRESIRHGLFTVDISVCTSPSIDTKMIFFNDCIKAIIKNLEDKVPNESNNTITKDIKEKQQYLTDIITSIKTSLASIYYYFSKKEKDNNADCISLSSNKPLRSSFLMRSTDSLQVMTGGFLEKCTIFCSKVHKKTNTLSIFKKGKSNKGHNFQDKIFDYPADCLFCSKLLWGINPQGLSCSNCLEAVHMNCKDHVRTYCLKDPKRVHHNLSNKNQHQMEIDLNKIGGPDEDTISVNSQASLTIGNNEKDYQDEMNIQNEVDEVIDKQITSSVSSEISQNIKNNNVMSTAKIYITNNDDVNSVNQDSESLDSVSEMNNGQPHDYSKGDLEFRHDMHYEEKKLFPNYISKGHVKSITHKYDQSNISRSQSDSSEHKATSGSMKRKSEMVDIPDLIPDSSAWADDPDMKVEETFEANKELEFFINHVTKSKDKAEYTRLLVLMEFHHKIKFTIMTLKRFYYVLIKPWPDEVLLFKTLSLNSITPLYELIKTLESTIEQCKNTTSYSKDLAQNVFNWLVSDNERNLLQWLNYSIDICCTNSLNLVKTSWKDSISDSKFSHVLQKRHNKIIMVESLSNMRPLLFNLPLIVSKISKDLSKFSKYKDETTLWELICEKFKKLPTFIDEHCMPLVQLINTGAIVNSLDRGNWAARLPTNDPSYEFILDFPKTAFHHKLFDFQEIKIMNFSECGDKNKTQATFVKEVSDAYAICYHDRLVLLQRENEKYHLKQFKATDTKINPTLMLENIHATKRMLKGIFELSLLFMDVAVLVQLILPKEDVWLRWDNFMKLKPNTKREIGVKVGVEISSTVKSRVETEAGCEAETVVETDTVFEADTVFESETVVQAEIEVTVDKYADIKAKLEDFTLCHSTFFKEDMKLEKNCNMDLVFQVPNDKNECLVGTSFAAINLLKACYDNISVSTNDDAIDNLLLNISSMKNRITDFINRPSKDIINTEDIQCEIINIPEDEIPDSSRPITTFESLSIEPGEYSGGELDFQPFTSLQQNDSITETIKDEISNEEDNLTNIDDLIKGGEFDLPENESSAEIIDSEVSNEEDKIGDINESTSDEYLLSFVDEYVRKIIEDAQIELTMVSSNDIESDNHQDDLSLTHVSSVISDSSV